MWGPADNSKVPAEVPEDSRVLRVRRLWFPTSNHLETWLIPSGTTWSRQYCESTVVWRNLPLYHRSQYFVLSFRQKEHDKAEVSIWGDGTIVRPLRQTMIDSRYCLDWFVLEGKSQVSRRSYVENHKRRTLNTRLSSGTSVGTFACPVWPYRNCRGKAGMKNEPNRSFVPDPKKWSKSRSSRFESTGPPLRVDLNPSTKKFTRS